MPSWTGSSHTSPERACPVGASVTKRSLLTTRAAQPGWLNTATYGLPPTPAWDAVQSALALTALLG
ncbi:MAG: hypothetical protein DLM60_14655 [Pseudonocardiales bacterium]|nr:MAG: hypothetical protein DLM60_14655 [Pseudonocardiales bacterium]